MSLKIATRKSKLAQTQTDFIREELEKRFGMKSEKVLIVTEGDRKLDITLDKIGGKGLFVKDIELALLEERSDAAIHSMKDVPFELNPEFEIVAIPSREDVRDVFVSKNGVSFFDLPKGAVIGTSSKRRAAQVSLLRPDMKTVPIRGNVETRLVKMKEEKMDGIILAAAGLIRLGLEKHITDYFDPLTFLPAVGQGALGVEVVKGSSNYDLFKKLDSEEIRTGVDAERSFMKALNGGCHTSLGAYSIIEGDYLHITGIFEVNDKLIKKDITGNRWDNVKLGRKLAEKILDV